MIRAAVEQVRTVHHGYTPEIDILGEDRAVGIWAMMDEIRDRQYKLILRGWGHYHETYERRGRGLAHQERASHACSCIQLPRPWRRARVRALRYV